VKTTHPSRAKTVESKIRRIKKISISEEIAKQIMDLISSGDLKPGQRLPSERELCEHFGASRSSLREALRCLSIVGVLNARVREGTSVAVDGGKFLRRIMEWRLITEKHDIVNLLEVRIALEGLSAANAALNCTAEDVEALRKLITKMKGCGKDEAQFAILDAELHVTIANASGNTVISDLVSVIRSQLVRALTKVLQSPNAIPLSIKEHISLVEAIAVHDSEEARRVMLDHLKAALTRYTESSGATKNARVPARRKPSSKPSRKSKVAQKAS